MPYILRHKKVSPFNAHMERFTKALVADHFKVRFVSNLPRGVMAACDTDSKTILFPIIDPSKFNETEAQKMMAFSAHERKHAMLTSKDSMLRYKKIVESRKHSSPFLEALMQIIEDCRIEMNKHYAKPGDLEDLAWLRGVFSNDLAKKRNLMLFGGIDPETGEEAKPNPLGWIIHAFQYDLLMEHPDFCEHDPLEMPNDPMSNKLYEIAWDILHDGRFHDSLNHGMGEKGCHVTLDLALEIEEAWSKLLPPPPPCEGGEGDGEGDSKSEEGKEGGGEGSGSGSGKSKSKSKKGGSDSNEVDWGNDGNSGEGDGNDEGDDDGDSSKDGRSDGEKIKDANDRFGNFDSEMHKSMAEEISQKQFPENDPTKLYDDDRPGSHHVDTRSEYIGFNPHDNYVTAKPNANSYNTAKNELGSRITQIRNMLAVRLKALTESQVLTPIRRGDLDQRQLYRTAKGLDSKNVFRQVYPGLEVSCAVGIVVDLSGSMAGEKSYLSMQMTILLAEVFNLLQIPFEVTGFNTNSVRGYDVFEYEDRLNGNCFRVNEYINYWMFKEFGDNFNSEEVRHRIGSIKGTGCNIDHEVIRWAASRLWKRPEKRKLQMVLSDGYPSGHYGAYADNLLGKELVKTNEEIRRAGIEQFGFGLQSEAVREYYTDYKVLTKLDDLNETSLQVFADFLTRGMNQVRI